MGAVQVTLPDGKKLVATSGSTVLDVVKQIGPGLAKAALAAKVDGRQVDLAYSLHENVSLEVLTFAQPEGREIFWHSSTHLMAQAIKELYPDTQLTIGPPIEEGFYYDFDKAEPFTAEDLEKIETFSRSSAVNGSALSKS